MQMAVIIDLFLAVVLVLCTVLGFRRGAFKSVIGIVIVVAALIGAGRTGYMSSVRNTTKPASEWIAGGIPITMMMNIERRHGHDKPVIRKALVELDGKPFAFFASKRGEWAKETAYVYPGPIQYFGPSEVCDLVTKTLMLEQSK